MSKIIILIYIISNIILITRAHDEDSISSEVNISDDMEKEKIHRRSQHNQEWQYEGLPIKFPMRRSDDNAIGDTDTSNLHSGENRRSLKQEREYEGLAIEYPSRRHAENDSDDTTEATTTSTSTVSGPPLDLRHRRIYHPDEIASVEDYPFIAALLVNGKLWCGAVIIDRDKVLTAAHCLQLQYNNRFFREYVKMLTVRVGSNNATADGEVLRVTEIFFHPNYKPQTLEFNVAVMKLHKDLTFGADRKVHSVEISRDKVVPVDNRILFLGWGSVLGFGGEGGQVLLHKVELPVYDLADCQQIYGRDLVTRNNFCAGYITQPKNVCNHDAGGPAIMDGLLIGILSFSSKRCDEPDMPAVFSTVGPVMSWIEDIGENKMQLRNTAIKSPEATLR